MTTGGPCVPADVQGHFRNQKIDIFNFRRFLIVGLRADFFIDDINIQIPDLLPEDLV